MEQVTTEFNPAKGRIAGDIKTVMTDGEDLLTAAANISSAGFTAVRKKIDEKPCSARGRLKDVSRAVIDNARRTTVGANQFVHGTPWAVIGAAVAASALIAFWATKR